VHPREIIIVEGHLLFTNPDILEHFDLKVYIDADADVRLSRRVLRMMQKPNFDVKAYLERYEKIEKPSYEKYIEPTKRIADIVIPNYGFSLEELDVHKQMVSMPAINLMVKEVITRVSQ